LMSRPLNRRPI